MDKTPYQEWILEAKAEARMTAKTDEYRIATLVRLLGAKHKRLGRISPNDLATLTKAADILVSLGVVKQIPQAEILNPWEETSIGSTKGTASATSNAENADTGPDTSVSGMRLGTGSLKWL